MNTASIIFLSIGILLVVIEIVLNKKSKDERGTDFVVDLSILGILIMFCYKITEVGRLF